MKLHFFKKNILLITLLFNFVGAYTQKTEMPATYETKFYEAVELYNAKLYAGAQKLFLDIIKNVDKKSNLKSEADYFDAMCAIKLKKTNASKKVLAFVKNHPYNSRKEKAYYNVGNYFFSNRKAANALQWYSKVNQDALTTDQRNEMNYKMGYALLINKYFADAKAKFGTLLGNPDYGNDARYYYGYISYRQENFEKARENFSKLANNATYKSNSSYYLLDIAFKNGDFKKAIEVGEKILPNCEKGQKSDIVKMIGESYFNIGEYKKSIPYLLEYKGEKGKWNNTDLYYIGYAYYKQQDYLNAVLYFTKILDGNNTIAQNAYYHLGICYLKLDKKAEALNAFKNAYDMKFDEKIQADAALNYTKLSYEEGNPYKSVPETLKEYLSTYPNSTSNSEVKELLIISYLHEHQFKEALSYLNLHKSPENKKLIWEVSLYRALQLFHKDQFRKSIPHFLKAVKSAHPKISNQAKFWLAESNYILGKHNISLKYFLEVDRNVGLKEFENLDYNIGYSYFKLNDYPNASTYFKKYINDPKANLEMKDDAINRLGDSYYAVKDYNNAIKNYNIIINDNFTKKEQNGVGADYALYQRAMSKGLLGNKETKLVDLAKFRTDYPESVYNDDALFQSATTYSSMNNEEKATENYNTLLENYPNSSYIPTVLLRKGLLYYNKSDYDDALEIFKNVVNRFPNSEEAKQAVTNVRNVYIDKGDIQPYIDWVETLPHVNISKREIDDSSFIAAQNIFFKDDFVTATISFNSYLQKFPKGAHLLKANFYLGEAHFNLDQKRKTIPAYTYVMNQEKNEHTEDAISKLAQVYLDLDKWDEAVPLLIRLEKEANLEHNVIFAKNNLMKSYYEKKNYEKAKEYSLKVLMTSKLDEVVDEDAKLILARISVIEDDMESARKYYEIVDKTATNETKAETLYYKGLFLHQDKLYKKSNEEIQQLIANYSNYKYWGVKSYIVMAKNYFELKDSYQAAYILESVVKNFSEFKDLTEEAKNELRKVKNEEAKQNESINSKMEKP